MRSWHDSSICPACRQLCDISDYASTEDSRFSNSDHTKDHCKTML